MVKIVECQFPIPIVKMNHYYQILETIEVYCIPRLGLAKNNSKNRGCMVKKEY